MKPSFKSFLIKSKFNRNIANLYSGAYDLILDKGLFDEVFYYNMYPGLRDSGIDPLFHYLFYGYKEGKVPSLIFEGNRYLDTYNDVSINPLVHFVLYGESEGRATFNSPILTHYERILETNKLFLNNYSFDFEPLVSIIILNRNGCSHLKRLFRNFDENTNYSNYEIIVVDNASSDGSLEFLESLKESLPLQVIRNEENLSFSKANNIAVNEVNGEYVLLLNNDMEPTYSWLNEMVGTILSDGSIGAVGAKLIYPYYYGDEDNFKSYLIQHAGDIFDERIKPCCAYAYNTNKYEHAFDTKVNKTKEVIAVTAASVLIKKSAYLELSGLDEDYFYGFEDVDFMLKLNKAGYKTVYASQALLFHHESSTRIQDKKGYEKNNTLNTKTLWAKKGDYITKNIFKDKLENKRFFTEKPFKFTFLVHDFDVKDELYPLISNLAKNLNSLEIDVELITDDLKQEASGDSDILISFSKDYDIDTLTYRANMIKILFTRENIESEAYDFIVSDIKDLEGVKFVNTESFPEDILTFIGEYVESI